MSWKRKAELHISVAVKEVKEEYINWKVSETNIVIRNTRRGRRRLQDGDERRRNYCDVLKEGEFD